MKRRASLLIAVIGLSANLAVSGAEDNGDRGKKIEEDSCQLCHSLRLIESQRLSAAAWQKEVDKMIGWGTVVPDRQVLIKYLTQHYSTTAPQPTPVLSGKNK